MYQRVVKNLWKAFGFVFAFVLVYIFCVEWNVLYLFGQSPGLEHLENPRTDQASELYTADSVLIGKYFKENRSPVSYSQLSPKLVDALIATEDIRFYEHSGIDPEAVISIFWYTLQGDRRGGSTITQQLAKNLYKTRTENSKGVLGHIPLVGTIISKTKEWLTAVKLERNYTKEEIITWYLNTVDFGSNSFGIKTASRTFFNTTPDSLTVEQAATLVGLLKATYMYSPRFNPENSLERRNVVLSQMVKYNYLTQPQYDSLSKLPIELDYNVENHYDGPATYFRGAVGSFVQKWCKDNGYDLYSDGLKVYTTIDSRMQAHAEAAVEKQMRNLQRKFYRHWDGKNPWVDEKDNEIPGFIEDAIKRTGYYRKLKKQYGKDQAKINQELNRPRKMKVFTWDGEKDTTLSPLDSLRHYKHLLHAGMMTVDPYTGHIKAWVGGINYKYFKYDHVQQAKRQPGSTFKPFVYVAAIDKGYAPCDKIVDQRITINYVEKGENKSWSPTNSDWEYTGAPMTLRRAIGKSVNSVTAQLTEKIGWDTVVEYAHKLGIKSPLQSVPSIGLGPSDVSIYEMVGAYSTFLNNGFWSEPMYVTRIEDRNGNIIAQFTPKQKKVLSEETAWLMVYMLKGGMEEPGGTSQALWEYDLWKNGNEIAGKTGTSSNHSDGWYMGLTKDLVTGVWVGGEDRSIHFRTSQLGEGSKTALPIYGIYMENLYQDKELGYTMGRFPKPTTKIHKSYYCPTPWPRKQQDSLQVQLTEIKLDAELDALNGL
ncbi:MAG: transglycosylase domain-containing protein [Hymenobacteraceae bacterium]|nr:transglycosylase domain-containing protein [Hymenobacteraceae bacterium]MDX5395193.1 transglycosylase domain-containing protein [Hymenobacteraceae bacterium]MDX5442492.1 transglycosylase domain-containing protein [Hymenobacteraceae bacterium]MDX5511231.1 transglycosylase domain-containing protein [Hymenobacteraceae bacterium]